MKFIHIADFHIDDIKGGAEWCDAAFIEELQKSHEVIKIRSHEVTTSFLDGFSDAKIIVSNFVNLSESTKEYLIEKRDYVIYEHDHKYLKTRDPSYFANYVAPKDQLVNVSFYNNALVVFAQSDLHGSVIKKNLPSANVEVVGFSLWLDSQLDILEKAEKHRVEEIVDKYFDATEANGFCILKSKIKHKGTEKARKWCVDRSEGYFEISGSWDDLIADMAIAKGFVFFPDTLETMSRVVVEARMLGLRVRCGENIGAVHQEWFSKKGKELIDLHRKAKGEIAQMVVDSFKKERTQTMEDITVILTLYKRPQNLRAQVEAIRNQTVKPKEIWLWINDHNSLNDDLGGNFKSRCYYQEDYHNELKNIGIDRFFHNNHNWKFYGRFSAALLAQTKYVAIYDDDTIPGKKWHENCLESMKQKPGIYGTAGVVLHGDSYNPHTRVGWPNPNTEITKVDLVGHAWFLQRDWIPNVWIEPIPTFDNGEDIQLSYCCQKYANIETFVPPHPIDDKSLWGSIRGNELGIDKVATSNNQQKSHNEFFSERDRCVKNALNGGWKLQRDCCK